MSHWLFRHLPLDRQRKEGFKKGFTMVELLMTVLIVGILAAIAIQQFTSYKTKQQNATATVDIRNIESQIERYRILNGSPPATLAAANIIPPIDPWGNAYIYVNPPNRLDKYGNPLNKDYDLLSTGQNGQTALQLSLTNALDDIIRGRGGAYIGLASKY